VQALVGYGLATALLLGHLRRGGDISVVLLLGYWALKLPVLGQMITQARLAYPQFRNIALRLLEPLERARGGRDRRPGSGAKQRPRPRTVTGIPVRGTRRESPSPCESGGPGDGTYDSRGRRPRDRAGISVAVVGPSGAGKTSLLSSAARLAPPVRGGPAGGREAASGRETAVAPSPHCVGGSCGAALEPKLPGQPLLRHL
jgi:hypothetical protein